MLFFPLPTTVKCPVAECNAKFRAEVWTCVKQSCIRHLRSLHIEPDVICVKCVGYDMTLGIRPGAHNCRMTIANDTDGSAEQYACTAVGCTRSFISKQGLVNHVREHRRRVAVEAAAVPLPRPATQQGIRSGAAARPPGRGGDARVPTMLAPGGIPRIPDNVLPETGGLPLVAEGTVMDGMPRIPGYVVPETSGTPPSPSRNTHQAALVMLRLLGMATFLVITQKITQRVVTSALTVSPVMAMRQTTIQT